MAKSFKLRFCRMINTTFQSCRSKDSSTLPLDPLPSSYICFSSVNPEFIPVDHHYPSSTTHPASSKLQLQHRSTIERHVSSSSSTFVSVGRGIPKNSFEDLSRVSRDFKWREEEKWHVVAKVYEESSQKPRRKIYNSSASGGSDKDEISALPPLPPTRLAAERKNRRRKIKKMKIPTRHRMSTSSVESGLFSNEEESLETETLVSSSRSFSTDSSSEYNPHLETIREKTLVSSGHHKRGKKKTKKQLKRSVSNTIYRPSSVSENESPARLSVFKKLIPCSVDGKVKESFAVIKKSDDPFEDFKRSMMEMILEKQMFEENDLEQLLLCFLSLNSRDHHRLIVQAFVEIWEAMFCASDRKFSHHPGRVHSSRSAALPA